MRKFSGTSKPARVPAPAPPSHGRESYIRSTTEEGESEREGKGKEKEVIREMRGGIERFVGRWGKSRRDRARSSLVQFREPSSATVTAVYGTAVLCRKS